MDATDFFQPVGNRRLLQTWFGTALILAATAAAPAATLSDPRVDAYNVRVGTETFAGLYKFTTNTLLVETAQAITNLGSDTIKFYLGPNTSGQSGVIRGPNITNLLTLARDEPSYRRVFDMPFRHFIVWAYPLSNPDAPFTDGNYTATEQANDYRELYDLTRYLLTNYNNSGKTFYLGHWEGDGYLKVNNWTTNPSPAVVTAMIAWENNRQKAVDDAKAATGFTNVNVYYYAEANRVRDAMLNGPTNNVRVINAVVPYVTNLDYLSYSSYDAEDLSAANLYATLDYMQALLPTNKAAVVPGGRIWIGEYGHGSWSTDAQEPFNRAYIQRLLNWNHNGQCLPFILYWEMYDNEPGKNFCLIDSNGVQTASWYLQHYFNNAARLRVAQFLETNGRLPSDTEFSSLMSPLLSQPLPAPVPLTVANAGATLLTNSAAAVSGTLAQGIYGDDEAGVWVFYGRQDGGTNPVAWESSRFIGFNTHFNPATFTATLTNLAPETNYCFRFCASNATAVAWAPASAQFSTATLHAADFGARLKIFFSGYDGTETLTHFPALVNLSTNLPGFSYRQFASPDGGDLRFTDAGGWRVIPHEIDEWNTNGVSSVWVCVPTLNPPPSTNNFIWAYWGNPEAANPPAYTTNGAVWPGFDLVWHLRENGFPFADSTLQYPASSGIAPVSTTGEIGHGELFNGSSQFLNAGPVNLGNAFTLAAWIRIDPTANNIQTVWANKPGGWNSAGFALYVNSYQTTDGKLILETGDGVSGQNASTATGAVSAGPWHFVAAAVNETTGAARLFVDGTDVTSSAAIVTDFPNQSALNLGRFTNSVFYFKGVMDEARVQAGVASSNWLRASWLTVASNAVFETYSSVTQPAPALAIRAGGANVSFTWPGSGVGFALYSATNLTPPVDWTPAANQPAWTNHQWQIILPAGNACARFYRLQSQ